MPVHAGTGEQATEAYFPAAYISIQSCLFVVLLMSCSCKEFIVLESTDPFHDCRNLSDMVSKVRHCRLFL
jgi:hypothetical protein